MSDQLTLPAEARDRVGKGASRALRRQGRVPAVVYGEKQEPLSIHVEEKLLSKILSTGHFMNSVVMIDFKGKPHRTLPKAVDFHPVTSRPIHVDFLRIGEHTKVHVAVPVRFDNEDASPGLKRGGVLNAVVHELEIVCDAASIPNDCAAPPTADATANPASPPTNVHLRPNRSLIRPPSSRRLPNASAYAVTIHCRSELAK